MKQFEYFILKERHLYYVYIRKVVSFLGITFYTNRKFEYLFYGSEALNTTSIGGLKYLLHKTHNVIRNDKVYKMNYNCENIEFIERQDLAKITNTIY